MSKIGQYLITWVGKVIVRAVVYIKCYHAIRVTLSKLKEIGCLVLPQVTAWMIAITPTIMR